jgi:hypothetical protein
MIKTKAMYRKDVLKGFILSTFPTSQRYENVSIFRHYK